MLRIDSAARPHGPAGPLLKAQVVVLLIVSGASAGEPERIRYNNPGLAVDLGVGLRAQPFPMDYDGDGDLDRVVLSGGKPVATSSRAQTDPRRPKSPDADAGAMGSV